MSVEAVRRQRLLEARERLLRVLSEITEAAHERSLVRCPYRTREDVCTLRGGCRNQIVQARAPRHCTGGALDPTPATMDQIRAALT